MKDREVGCHNLRAGKEGYPHNEGLVLRIVQIADYEICWL